MLGMRAQGEVKRRAPHAWRAGRQKLIRTRETHMSSRSRLPSALGAAARALLEALILARRESRGTVDEIRFPDDCSDLDGSEEQRWEYIKALLEVASDDARHVTLLVSVALAAILVVIVQMPIKNVLALPLGMRILLVVGVAFLALGALSVFRYVRAVHLARFGIARCLASANARHARQLWAGEVGVWETKGTYYTVGIRAMGLGFAAVSAAVCYLIVSG